MASIYYITEHKYQTQLLFPHKHLGVVIATLDTRVVSNLTEGTDYWQDSKVYDRISYYLYTLTPEAFRRLSDVYEVYRTTRANKLQGVDKMNLQIWLKQERTRLDEQVLETLYQQVLDNCTMRNIFDAAISSLPKNRHAEFMKACVMLSRYN